MPNFENVGERLYRYVPTGGYYARLEVNGKEVRRSLGTTDRATAKRKLVDLQRGLIRTAGAGDRITLVQLCDRYLATVQNQSPKTLASKTRIARLIKREWPGGASVQISKVVESHVATWLASYSFGAASYNLYLEFARAAFQLAVRDRLIADSPVDGIKTRKRLKPIRPTPTWEQFLAIVAEVRAQVSNAGAADSGDFVEFIGLAGLGQAEASALKWADLNWAEGKFTTFRWKTGQGFEVPIFPQLRPLLERMRQDRGGSPPGPSKVFRLASATKAIHGACKRLGLPAYSHRSFRRMFITRAIELGVDVKVIAAWQGHRDGGKLILDTYSHVRPTHSDAMAKLMRAESLPTDSLQGTVRSQDPKTFRKSSVTPSLPGS